MRIDSFEQVGELRKTRELALHTLEAAKNGSLNCDLWLGGVMFKAADCAPELMIRQAVMDGCADLILDCNKKLAALGVGTPPFPDDRGQSAESLRRDINMYTNAWIRELGGRLIPKSHLIDALVLTTRALRAKAEAADKVTA